jgi:sugar-specific transcriptional regulator TrmB
VKVQDVIDRLSVLGLDHDEAAVYVHLSMMGPSKASDIAAAVKLHRTETYRTLQNLVQRGFATATLSRPARFEAAAPEKLFHEILEAQQARQDSIARVQSEIADALTTLRGAPGQAMSKNTFKVLQGRREIYGVMERMVRDAERSIKTVSTHEGAVMMSDMAGIMDLAVRRAKEGVQVRAVLKTTPPTRQRLAPLLDIPTVGLRHVDAEGIIRFVVLDLRELLIWVVSDPSSRLTSEQDVAIWTDATDFVGTQSVLFDSLWREAKDVRSMLVAEGVVADRGSGVPR